MTLRILAVKHRWFDATNCIRREIEREIGMPLSIDYIEDEWEMYLESKRRIAAGHSDYDLFMVDSIWIYEYVKRGMIAPLDEQFASHDVPSGYDFDDLIPQYVEHFCTVDGTLFCLPLSGHTNFLAYRKDLFDEHGLKSPLTQQELLHCAEEITGNGMYGITLRGKGFELAYTYMLFLYPNGGRVLNEECSPCLDTAEALTTLEYLKELWRYTPPDVLEYSFPDMAASFQNGLAAIYHDASVGAILVHECDLRERFGYALTPAGAGVRTSVAGWGMGIAAASPHREQALGWLLAVTGKRHAERIFREGRDPIRMSTLKNPGLRDEFPFLRAIEDNLRYATAWFRPPIPELAGVLDILGRKIAAVLKGEYQPEEGLIQAQREIGDYLKGAGY
jgi:multiple sugar transport system substrate-binding protein